MGGCILSLIWVLLLNDSISLYLALFCFGFFNGAWAICAYAFVVELIEPESRKTISIITNFSVCAGLIFANVIFWVFWSGTVFIQIFTMIYIAIFLIIWISPESPEFLYVKEWYTELREVFRIISWVNLRGDFAHKFDKESNPNSSLLE